LSELPPFVDPGGDEEKEGSVALATALAACFAAFSARRFCFDAEGGMAGWGAKNE